MYLIPEYQFIFFIRCSSLLNYFFNIHIYSSIPIYIICIENYCLTSIKYYYFCISKGENAIEIVMYPQIPKLAI